MILITLVPLLIKLFLNHFMILQFLEQLPMDLVNGQLNKCARFAEASLKYTMDIQADRLGLNQSDVKKSGVNDPGDYSNTQIMPLPKNEQEQKKKVGESKDFTEELQHKLGTDFKRGTDVRAKKVMKKSLFAGGGKSIDDIKKGKRGSTAGGKDKGKKGGEGDKKMQKKIWGEHGGESEEDEEEEEKVSPTKKGD